jgi:predicted phage replisome organizer
MEHGDEMVVFYLALLTESIDHEGALRFNEDTPYTTQMLAYVTDTDEEIAEKAMTTLIGLGMVKVLEDGTFFMPELEGLINYETDYARQKREWREEKKQKEDNVQTMSEECPDDVKTMSDKSKSKSKSKSIEKDTKERNGVSLYAFGEFQNVLLTTEEHDKLANEFGLETTKCVLEELSGYLVEHPRKYTNHYLTLRNWLLKRREVKAVARPQPQPIVSKPKYGVDEDEWKRLVAEEVKRRGEQ